tara:strand:+ start:73 stop:846 length:774 start_codon:yes stop_codon:yes gene_type:complete
MPYLGSSPARGLVGTANIDDDAITLAKMAAGTDGNLITYDASGNPAAVAAGTSGHYLKSQGAGSVPVFAEVATGGGSWDHITTVTPTGSSQAFTCGSGSTLNTNNHDLFKIEIIMSINSTTSEVLNMTPVGAGAIRIAGNYTRGGNDTGALTGYSSLSTTGAASSGVVDEVTATDPAVAICGDGANRVSGTILYYPMGASTRLSGRIIFRDSNGSNWRMGIFDWAASVNSEPTSLSFAYASNFGSGTEMSAYGLRQS